MADELYDMIYLYVIIGNKPSMNFCDDCSVTVCKIMYNS
jgi:hypothetical protein